MTTTESPLNKATNGVRIALGVGGLLALVVGILVLAWPVKTAGVVAVLLAIYTIASGIVYAGIGIFAKGLGGWARIGHVLLGVLFIVAGVIALQDVQNLTLVLAIFVAIFIGISWIVEGVVSLTTLGEGGARGWTIFFAIVSIVAGVTILFAPLFAATLLWIYLGAFLAVIGVFQIIRAFSFGKTPVA